ncbi:MAG TPA: hypothetical protein VGQ04_00975 [Chitinophagaceae bacterium]|jgi:hypothetical protein|nr:hypothetical protein [Chitinophagaceae bacterium]
MMMAVIGPRFDKHLVGFGGEEFGLLNIGRNKMVLRLAALIKINKPYQKIAAWSFYYNP